MRVIAGAAKGHKLQTIEGLNTRPTTDRIKETLFNIIAFDLPESRFLDVFSGRPDQQRCADRTCTAVGREGNL